MYIGRLDTAYGGVYWNKNRKVIVHCKWKKMPLGQQAILQEEKTDNLCRQRYYKACILADKISHDNITEAQQEDLLILCVLHCCLFSQKKSGMKH